MLALGCFVCVLGYYALTSNGRWLTGERAQMFKWIVGILVLALLAFVLLAPIGPVPGPVARPDLLTPTVDTAGSTSW